MAESLETVAVGNKQTWHDMELLKYKQTLPAGSIAGQVNESLRGVPRLVVTAPPGAGKSTLLPLTILEELEEGKILMLEPRRLAARQIAERMAQMLGEGVGQTVGYRMRFDNKVSASTRIEVITEGILSRMLIDDPMLEGVSVVIFDEFHERSLFSDLALALTREASQVVRPDLRILIMSATIDATAIGQTLDAPVIESEGRMHDVETVHLEDTDPRSCAADVASAIRMAHRRHAGDILAFLPGQAEIMKCSQLLADTLGPTALCPLYGMLPPSVQRLALRPSAEGRRKVVLATSIAETSLTIEGIRIVVDSGLCRTLVFNPSNGFSRLETVRISIDMARQRTGRAGRLGEGVCYRLWTKATEQRMSECRQPEIMEADLAPTVLDVAAWGERDIQRLPWLTPPPQGHVAQAGQLLRLLEAIDEKGRLTAHGRKLAALPCHPRIAQMLACGETDAQKALAADIAALLEERDLVGDGHDADINTRIALLREQRKRPSGGRWGRVVQIAEQYRRMVKAVEHNEMPSPYETGMLIASAYPERIAMATAAPRGSKGEPDGVWYKLASGDLVTLDRNDNLSGCPLLAVAALGARVFLASPLKRESLSRLAHWRDNVSWDSRQARVVAQRELRLGSLILDIRPVEGNVGQQIVAVVCEAARKEGASMFDFNSKVNDMQCRLATVAAWHPELQLPEVTADALMKRAADWLPFYIGRATTAAELKRIDLCVAIWGLLSYEQQQAVERMAPTHIRVPSGRNIRIDYRQGAKAPVLSVRLQECFGLTDTPCVDEGKRPVLMELLSPGFKPVQLTQDLGNFWQNTYFEVRKELRRRYPKHRWPDNPLDP